MPAGFCSGRQMFSESPTEVDLQDTVTGFLPTPIYGIAIQFDVTVG